MKKVRFILVIFALLSSNTFAYNVEVDGIYYNAYIQDLTMHVTSGDKNYSGNIVIPSHVEYDGKKYTVTRIDSRAFKNVDPNSGTGENTSLLSVKLPNTIISIGDQAFANCSKLTSINIPESCKYFEDSAFENCSSLKSIYIPKNVVQFGVGNYLFNGCTSLEEITIEDGNTIVNKFDEKYTFIIGPIDAVKTCYYGREIGFSSKNIENLTIGDSIETILKNAFSKIPLKHLRIPKNILSIGSYAFSSIVSLSDLIIDDSKSPLEIESGFAASSLNGLTKKRALYIGRDMIPKSHNSYIYSIFEDTKDLYSITFGECVTNGKQESYGDYYGIWAFSNCQDIQEIYVRKEIPFEITEGTFNKNTYLNTILFVPKGSKQKYMECEGWKNFLQFKKWTLKTCGMDLSILKITSRRAQELIAHL